MTNGSGIKTVWLDNPPVNAVDAGIVETLWRELEDDLGDDTRVVVLRGKRRPRLLGGRDIAGFQRRRRGRPAPAGSSRSPT